MTRPVSDLTLERYRLGELPADRAAEVQQWLAEDEGLARRLSALEASDATIRAEHGGWAEEVRRRSAARAAARGHRPIVAIGALAAAALVAAVMMPRAFAPSAEDTSVRVKGLRPALVLFRKTPRSSEALENGARVRAGDLIRLGYRSAGRKYGAIVSIDGRGQVTRHLPRQGSAAARLSAGDAILLDHAYELDDAPRWERFYLITADAPFEMALPMDAARRAARPAGAAPETLPLPPELEQSTFTLGKETTR